MGISTWSMHNTGMLAFRLPIPIEYDWPTAFLSYLASFCTSALGLFVVSRRKMGFVRAFTGMRERVTLLGGEMDCKSAPGRGTEIHAFFPVRTRSDAQEPGL